MLPASYGLNKAGLDSYSWCSNNGRATAYPVFTQYLQGLYPQRDTIHFFSKSSSTLSVISGFRRDADEICPLLGYNAASSGNPPLDAALYPRRMQISSSTLYNPQLPKHR
jgi:hypothetical protein